MWTIGFGHTEKRKTEEVKGEKAPVKTETDWKVTVWSPDVGETFLASCLLPFGTAQRWKQTLRCTALLPEGEMRRMWWKFVYLYTASGFYIHFFFIAVKVHQCESELWGKQGGCLASFKRKNQPDEHYMAPSSSKQVRDDGGAPASYTHLRPGVCVCVFTWLCSSLCCLSLRFSGVSATMVNDVLG